MSIDIGRTFTANHVTVDEQLTDVAHMLEQIRGARRADLESLRRLRTVSRRIGAALRERLAREQDIEPVVEHVLGCGLDEISDMNQHASVLLAAFQRFELTVEDAFRHASDGGVSVFELMDTFSDFVTIYEAHTDLERGFFSEYSTILFPAATH